jgi:hypothetical protein
MASLKHTHSLVQWKKRGKDQEMHWKCADPECTFFAPQSLVIDKLTLCPECKTVTFILDWEDDLLRRARPLCINCRNTASAREFKAVKEVVSGLFEEKKV